MGPLTREIQAIQNDLVKLTRRLDRFQAKAQEAEQAWLLAQAEAARLEKLERMQTADWHDSGLRVGANGRVSIKTEKGETT